MRKLHVIAGLLIALSVIAANDPGKSGWTLIKKDGDIQVFTQNETAGQTLGVKGVCRTTVRFEVLAEVLLNVEAYPQWLNELKESRIIEQNSAEDFLLYNYYDLPWPFADRDIYLRVQIQYDIKNGIALAYIEREDNPAFPPVTGAVRIPAMLGILEIRYIDRETTEGSFTEWFDMGGRVPDWLKVYFARHIPSSILKSVSEACKSTENRLRGANSFLSKKIEAAITEGNLKR
jgi:hypothetical protein